MDPDWKTKDPRELAFLALIAAERDDIYIQDTLEHWKGEVNPPSIDFGLAREIAYGTMRMKLALDYLAKKLVDNNKLNVKLRERILIRTALYQHYYMSKIPVYAIVNESVKIGKKYCHSTFVKFLNATLRKLEGSAADLPKGNSPQDLSIRFSYPVYFVEQLIKDYGLDKAVEVMEAGNSAGVTMYRIRSDRFDSSDSKGESQDSALVGREELRGEIMAESPVPMGVVRDASIIPKIAASKDYYIQNVTPANLMLNLANYFKRNSKNLRSTPIKVLDLCSSPGGKLIAIADMFPEAKLYANDVSPEKLEAIRENLQKYGFEASLSCSRGEEYVSEGGVLFDVIIVDAPCSNTGVLNKRPEARWRLSPENLESLEKIQYQLMKHALTLLAPGGQIWYMTCSILKDENLGVVNRVCGVGAESEGCERCGMGERCGVGEGGEGCVGSEGGEANEGSGRSVGVKVCETVLPNIEGWDGGFGCVISRI